MPRDEAAVRRKVKGVELVTGQDGYEVVMKIATPAVTWTRLGNKPSLARYQFGMSMDQARELLSKLQEVLT